jgi:hypothetical protein
VSDAPTQPAKPAASKQPPRPIHWPSLIPGEAAEEWEALRQWVEALRIRFPHAVRLPNCWWQHNDLVEALSALRDHERASYADTASATGPVDWHRAFRDIEQRLEVWIKRLGCTSDRGHQPPAQPVDTTPDGWADYVKADVRRRKQSKGQQ